MVLKDNTKWQMTTGGINGTIAIDMFVIDMYIPTWKATVWSCMSRTVAIILRLNNNFQSTLLY